ncbi:SDR family oxidoreductase [Nonomuraea sp. NEAU-A123]|uniref:SDR family oxidoreductase n=1 Tax=Nonomuraea sp. NEAU-A123 TaxID=2839649 RepID=UPI001BE4B45F|nr:NAD(P)H-binding protein [Nonomuraea sp. NEAU-A123]MBT2235644.1 NAD(P)H-binding protein [Nonomuraea sp. NEAU-A123]
MIVVFGGTGRVGRQIVEQLRHEGKAVRVVTRDPASANAVQGVEVVAGDIHDRRTLVRAASGAEAIVCTIQGGDGKGNNGPKGIEGSGIPSLIGIACDTAVENFVYISSASARADSPVGFFRLKFEVERLLRTSGLPYSILRPTHLMDTWVEMLAGSITKKGKATVLGSGTSPVSWVAGKDVARVAAALAIHPGEGWSADLGGPEALPLTKVNELIAASLGLRINGQNKMPVGMLRVMSPLTRPFNEVLARQMQMGALLDTQPQIVDSSAVWARFGEPLSLSAWLEVNRPRDREGV